MSTEAVSKPETKFANADFADEFLEIDCNIPLLDFKHTTLFAFTLCLYNSDTDTYS